MRQVLIVAALSLLTDPFTMSVPAVMLVGPV